MLVCVFFTSQFVKRLAAIIVGGWLKSEKLNLCTNPDWIYLFVCFLFPHQSAPTCSVRHGLLNSSIWIGIKAKITAIADQHEA